MKESLVRFASVAAALSALTLPGCNRAAALPAAAPAPDVALLAEDGTSEQLASRLKRSPTTVAIFFSSHCPVQSVHDARLRELIATYGPRGVAFVGLSAEVGDDLAVENAEARKRGLTFPVLADRGAALADALGVEYSTHAVVFDGSARVLYSGALDSDRGHLTPDAQHHLRNALDDVAGGRPVRTPKTEALGCPIRKH